MSNQITVPFKPHWQQKMLLGQKTCTSRTKKYGNPNDTFEQFGSNFRIVSIEKHRLDYVAYSLYKEEGCFSPEEFMREWMKLHPRAGWVPIQVVFVHFFRKED